MSEKHMLKRRLLELEETVAELRESNAGLFTQMQRTMDALRASNMELTRRVIVVETTNAVLRQMVGEFGLSPLPDHAAEEQEPVPTVFIRPWSVLPGQASTPSIRIVSSGTPEISPSTTTSLVSSDFSARLRGIPSPGASNILASTIASPTSANTSVLSTDTRSSSVSSAVATAGSSSTVTVAANLLSSHAVIPPRSRPAISAERTEALSKDLWDAATEGNADKIYRLVAQGAGFRYRGDDSGSTALQEAAGEGYLGALKALIHLEAPLDERDNMGDTALHEAVWCNKKVCVNMLLSAGASVNARNNNASIPLHYAAEKASPSIVRSLIKAGADRLAKNSDGVLPKDLAKNDTILALLSASK